MAAYSFVNETGCTQLVAEPTHVSGNCLDLLITDVPGMCNVSVGPQIGTSDHFFLSLKLQLNSPIPDFTTSKRVYLKSRVNWEAVEAEVASIEWPAIINHPSPADKLNDVVSHIITRFVPSKVIKFRSRDRPWFNAECRTAYHRKQTAFHRWSRRRTPEHWELYREARNLATITFNRAESNYNLLLREKLSNSRNSHSWWKNLKFSLFGIDSAAAPLKKPDGSLTYVPAEKAKILADHFNSKMSHGNVNIPSTCIPEPKLNSLAFRSSEVQKLLVSLDEHGGVDPNGFFPSFFKKFSKIFAPKLSAMFRKLIHLGEFPSCWKIASVTPIPKEGNSCRAKDFRPISITPVLSKVFERLIASRLHKFIETERILPKTQFGYRKGLGTVDALLTFTSDIQAALNDGAEVRAVAIDFSAAFDRVNHRGIIYNLQNIGVGGKFLSLCESFLAERRQYVTVDGCRSPTSNVPSGVPQGSVLGPLFFTLYTSSLIAGLSCPNIAYADDTTIYIVIPKPSHRIACSRKLNTDLAFIHEWCVQWGMDLNPTKSKSTIFSRSRTIFPEHPELCINDTAIENVTDLRLLGVLFDSKLTFESHVRNVTSIVSQKVGILRKCWQTFQEDALVMKCFYAFILPFFEYCSVVWLSTAPTHLNMLHRVFMSARFLLRQHISLDHRRSVAALCIFYKIYNNPDHPMHSRLPEPAVFVRRTRRNQRLNSRSLRSVISVNSAQFNRSFLPCTVEAWNALPQVLVDAASMESFKRGVNKHLLAE